MKKKKPKPRYFDAALVAAFLALGMLAVVWIGQADAEEPSSWDLIDQAAAMMQPTAAAPSIAIREDVMRDLRDGDCLKLENGMLNKIDCNDHCAKEAQPK